MKISVNIIGVILSGMAGLITFIIFGYNINTWQYWVILIPAVIVIKKWIDIFYKIHRRKREM